MGVRVAGLYLEIIVVFGKWMTSNMSSFTLKSVCTHLPISHVKA